MKNKKILNVSNLAYTISFIFALGVLAKTYMDRSKVPPGVCTIDNNRGLLITAIVILLIVTVTTSVIEYRKKK